MITKRNFLRTVATGVAAGAAVALPQAAMAHDTGKLRLSAEFADALVQSREGRSILAGILLGQAGDDLTKAGREDIAAATEAAAQVMDWMKETVGSGEPQMLKITIRLKFKRWTLEITIET